MQHTRLNRMTGGLGDFFRVLGGAGAIREQARADRERELLALGIGRQRLRKLGAQADITERQRDVLLGRALADAFRAVGLDQPEAYATLAQGMGTAFDPTKIGAFAGQRQDQRFRGQAVDAFRKGDALLGNVMLRAGGREPLALTRVNEKGIAFNPYQAPDTTQIRMTDLARAFQRAQDALAEQRLAKAEAALAEAGGGTGPSGAEGATGPVPGGKVKASIWNAARAALADLAGAKIDRITGGIQFGTSADAEVYRLAVPILSELINAGHDPIAAASIAWQRARQAHQIDRILAGDLSVVPEEVRRQAEEAVRARMGAKDWLPFVEPSQEDIAIEVLRRMGVLPAPRTKAEYDALPSGTRFIDPEGKVRVKP